MTDLKELIDQLQAKADDGRVKYNGKPCGKCNCLEIAEELDGGVRQYPCLGDNFSEPLTALSKDIKQQER